MALPPDERRDCEKVNQAAKISKKPQKKLGANAGLTIIRHDPGLERVARRARYPDDTRRAPAKPPAQPVGIAESKRKRTSWQKPPASTPAHRRGFFLGVGYRT